MKIENGIKKLERGDKIKVQSILAEIATCHYQDYDPNNDTFIAEFYDTNGNIRNWHQTSDGGVVIPRPESKEIWVGFEKQHADDDDSIYNFDAMKTFDTEREAMDWRDKNIEYRVYKYCGSVNLTN